MELDFLNELNESQRQAVEHCDSPSLVIAGAGSGKTRVLTYKIAYLLKRGISPWNILALTFTNKAAREMRERIEKLVSESDARALWMGTFHSIFARILRIEAAYVGFDSRFTIYDAQDSQTVLKQIIKELGLDDKKYKLGMVAGRISEAKNNLVNAQAYANSYETMQRDRMQQLGELHRIYAIYDQKLKASNAMDFDDLLMNTHALLKNNPDIAQKYQDKFQYVLVDEYQDTNRVQHEIVKLLTNRNRRVCVVGDDAQSIYSFRGAVIDNILDFQHLYPNTQLFKLERNYRSTQTIVEAANSLINHNRHQIRKDVYSKKEKGELIEVMEAYSDKEEASMVVRQINRMRQQGMDFKDIAILYRTNSQSRTFEEELLHQNFPYRIIGGFSFYQRKEVKDAVAYMRLAVNVYDEAALRRVINVPARGIGQTTIEKVSQCAVNNNVGMWDVISNPAQYDAPLNAGTITKLQNFAKFIMEANAMAQEQNAHEVALHLIRESGYWQYIFQGHSTEDISSQQYLQELVDGIAGYVEDATETGGLTSMAQYLQDIALLSDTEEGEEQSDNKITLMTAHSAKGLEFPVVFVVGMEEGLFPSERESSEREIEEERRLFYVAITRAEQRLFITWSRSRVRYGKFENNSRSRFVSEIAPQYLNKRDRTGRSLYNAETTVQNSRPASNTVVPKPAPVLPVNSSSLRSVRSVSSSYTAQAPLSGDGARLRVGNVIRHSRFGCGKVMAIEGTGLDTKAVVDFDNLGVKQLLLRFSKFEIIKN